MNYYFVVNNKEDAEKTKRTLEKLGFIVPDILSYHILYFAVGGQVYGIQNADSERYKPLVDYIKSHSDITKLVLDIEPMFNHGDYIKQKSNGRIAMVVDYVKNARCYVCNEHFSNRTFVLTLEGQEAFEKIDSTLNLAISPKFCVGQKVRHKGSQTGYYAKITAVLAHSYNVVDCDGIPNSFSFEWQDDWELYTKFNVGDLVVWGGCLGRITKQSESGVMFRVGERWVHEDQIRKADHMDEIHILRGEEKST